VFEPFVQIPSATRYARGGLGIGLTLVKRLVELHGGRVSASSEGMGKGCRFVVTLPRHDERARAAEPVAAGAPSFVPAHEPRKVLLVDDNLDASETLQDALRTWGHNVRAVADGPSGLSAVEAWHPDLALIDIGMPGMDGYEVARRIRAAPASHDLHMFALTGFGQASDRLRATEAGFERHFVKPVDLPELLRAIDHLG
jgi:CheY-like chemotaxis protein